MTKDELIDAWCKYRGRCTSEDLAVLRFAHRVLTQKNEPKETGETPLCHTCKHYTEYRYTGGTKWYGYCMKVKYKPVEPSEIKTCEDYEEDIDG